MKSNNLPAVKRIIRFFNPLFRIFLKIYNMILIIYYSFIIIHNHTNMQQQYLSPIIKLIRDHIEDEDGDARRV